MWFQLAQIVTLHFVILSIVSASSNRVSASSNRVVADGAGSGGVRSSSISSSSSSIGVVAVAVSVVVLWTQCAQAGTPACCGVVGLIMPYDRRTMLKPEPPMTCPHCQHVLVANDIIVIMEGERRRDAYFEDWGTCCVPCFTSRTATREFTSSTSYVWQHYAGISVQYKTL